MGLGFFIAKTLLERSGATVTLENRPAPATGAVAQVSWPRAVFDEPQADGQAPMQAERQDTG
jgi:two-component system sensor histidine kinase RegB